MRPAGLTTDKAIRALIFALICWAIAGHAHDGLDLAPPRAVPEAWNVITLCHANMRYLSGEERWAEVPIQSSLSIQALRFLRETAPPDPAIGSRRAQIEELEKVALAIFNACQGSAAEEAKKLLAHYSMRLGELARGFDAAIVHAIVYSCPMCRGIRELDPKTPCFKCGMDLEARSIPASEVYNTPGEPSILLTPIMERPLVAGEARSVRLRIRRKKDAAPITPDDLLVVHTERIHLLIIDESLGDYHHEHPVPTEVPGEYLFTFTPKRPGAYRIFADLVPKLSRVQEYAVCDLPGSARGEALQDRVSTFASSAGDLKFNLQWRTPPSGLKAKVPVNAQVTVFAPDATPFTQLEPVMGTYAHIVGFYEDRQTVLHIHPSGGPEPQRPEDRGGPLMKFRFYAPKPGFIRLYVQVQVGGTSRFAPFNVSILP